MEAKYTIKEALADFYSNHDYGEEGGINKNFAWIKFGFVKLPIPNLAARKKNIYMHDINHIVTGYETNWKGESSIGAWEIASGGWKKNYFPYLLTLWAMGLGVLFYPKSTIQAFRRGLTMRNALTCGISKSELLNFGVKEFKTRISNQPNTNKKLNNWMIISLVIFLMPFVLGISGIWAVLYFLNI